MNLVQLLQVPWDQGLLVALSVGLAALIRAFTGFGFAMLVVPAFSFFLSPGDAVVLSAVLALLLGLTQLPILVAVVSRGTSQADGDWECDRYRHGGLVFGFAVRQ